MLLTESRSQMQQPQNQQQTVMTKAQEHRPVKIISDKKVAVVHKNKAALRDHHKLVSLSVLVYPVTPLLQSTHSRPESRIVTPHHENISSRKMRELANIEFK